MKSIHYLRMWQVLLIVNAVSFTVAFGKSSWGNVGFTGFFLVWAVIGTAFYSYKVDKEATEKPE